MGLVNERNESVEVTTDTAAKRGLAPSEEAWRGWLYNGGHAVSCTPKVCCLMTCTFGQSSKEQDEQFCRSCTETVPAKSGSCKAFY